MKKVQYEQHSGIYKAADIQDILQLAVNDKNVIGNNKGCKFYNVPSAFDIEVSSFYRDEDGSTYTYEQYTKLGVKMEKCAIMYVWQFGINGYVIVGRTWDEFVTMCNTIAQTLELSPNKKLIVYIHNLSYEFQFIRTLLNGKRFSVLIYANLYTLLQQ